MRKLLAVAMLFSVACKSKDKAPPATTGGAPVVAAPILEPVGMVEPFARLTSESGKSLSKGYRALKAKKYDDAVAAFREVMAAVPDYTPARIALVRALVLGGQFAEVPKEFEALIARDYLGYATALDTKKEFAGLRAAPQWAKIEELKTNYRPAFAKGLDGGFCFVARTHGASEPEFIGGATDTALDLKQEVFHYDPDGKRFRRLTETGGHAFAVDRAPDGKTLVFMSAPRLHRENGADSFTDPMIGQVDLTTLETVGPRTAAGRFESVTLGFEKSGSPVFELFDPGTHQAKWLRFDTAKTGLASVSDAERAGGFTTATPTRVTHVSGKEIENVTIEDGANQFKIATMAAPVVAARPLAAESLDWSPAKTRLTYAGKIDACKILKGASKEKNELYVFDTAKKSAQRVAAAISGFETLWLDDDRLIYEGGVGKDGQLHLYSFADHADTALPTRYGAGLYGVPTLACEQPAESESAEPASDEKTDEAEGD